MAMDMKLWIDIKWDIMDIIDFLERKYEKKAKIRSKDMSPGNYIIKFEESFELLIDIACWTPVGRVTILSIDCGDEHREILRSIAEMFGGVLHPIEYYDEDVYFKYDLEVFDGKFSPDEGWISWVKQAILECIEPEDTDALSELIENTKAEWNISREKVLKKEQDLSRWE